MRYSTLFLVFFTILFSAPAQAARFFVDPLYWRATDTVDWAATSNVSGSNQDITYLTINFGFEPGIRVGAGYTDAWETQLYLTHFSTKETDSASGDLIPAFLGAKLALGSGTYTAGQTEMNIRYNIADWEIGQAFKITPSFTLHPLVGLTGGTIEQHITTSFQGTASNTEKMKNDFTGLGPKVGINSVFSRTQNENLSLDFSAGFSLSYLWGHWDLEDILHHQAPSTGDDVDIDVGDHNIGSLAMRASLGASAHYKQATIGLYYDLNDWFNQTQIFDDATGGHTNDLILQGVRLTLGLTL